MTGRFKICLIGMMVRFVGELRILKGKAVRFMYPRDTLIQSLSEHREIARRIILRIVSARSLRQHERQVKKQPSRMIITDPLWGLCNFAESMF